jgi:hypothetical protein
MGCPKISLIEALLRDPIQDERQLNAITPSL